ncbi:MAG TPA: fibronectin type III domain-containing protein [Kiritimatiellia bacterium]|nr:fibronectin type III domain-containing protein [Kiritimatiellia bacterium]HMO99995.1 fibronectin type III domain-containing protein [Kiritimatiellia bacterium]
MNHLFRHLAILVLVSLQASAQPLSLSDQRIPGQIPSSTLMLQEREADTVSVRHSGDDWGSDHAMHRNPDNPALWRLAVDELKWSPGVYEFKFLINHAWEEGPNRFAYINAEGLLYQPTALYLTWQNDPTTTMTVHWISEENEPSGKIRFREENHDAWQTAFGRSEALPATDRMIHTVEITGLSPDRTYVFQYAGRTNEYRFRTLPADLNRPVRFLQGGDVFQEGAVMDRMNRLAGSLDPDFCVIGGDLAYADGRGENVGRWFRYFHSFYEHLRAPDGRLIPVVVTIGNHEMRDHYLTNHEDYRPGPEWQRRVAPYFYRLFAMPGHPGYAVLDIGNYASFLLLDSGHTTPVSGPQARWLAARLAEREHFPHVFPVYHVPAYPSVRDPSDPLNAEIREVWAPLFEAHGIRLAFEHHDHALKITHPLRNGKIHPEGIVYLGDGAWSANLRLPRTVQESPEFRLTASVNHLFEVTLEERQRTVRTVAIDGQILDVFVQPVGDKATGSEP